MAVKLMYVVALAGLVLGAARNASGMVMLEDAESIVEQDLQQQGSQGYTITFIKADYLSASFPGTEFFGVHFQQYPVAVAPPEGLAPSDVAVVQNGAVYYLTSANDLKAFFFEQLGPVQGQDGAVAAGLSWVRLSEELTQDGFYTFSDPEGGFLPPPADGNGGVVLSWVIVTGGGTGRIDAALSFDDDGTLMQVQETNTVQPGDRPI
jgi:hypothetical protein